MPNTTSVPRFSWKISAHTAVVAGAAAVLTVQFGPGWGLLTATAAPITGWSRCRLRDHTAAQVFTGATVGAIVVAGVFGPLSG